MKYSFFSKGINREQVSLEEFQRKKYIVREKKNKYINDATKIFSKVCDKEQFGAIFKIFSVDFSLFLSLQ